MKTRTVVASAVLWSIIYAALLSLAGCVSYAKVEREGCRAIARGSFFSFNTPSVIEECRPDTDR